MFSHENVDLRLLNFSNVPTSLHCMEASQQCCLKRNKIVSTQHTEHYTNLKRQNILHFWIFSTYVAKYRLDAGSQMHRLSRDAVVTEI